MQNIVSMLTEYGLNSRESEVFSYLFKNNDCSAFRIAKDIRMPKTTVYGILESLKAQGLVSSWKKNGITHFSPESPNRLISILKYKEEIANKIIPELRKLSDTSRLVPSLRLYTGKDGVKLVLDEILETSKNKRLTLIYCVAHPDFSDYFPRQTNKWIREREQHGIRIQIIKPDLPSAQNDPTYTPNVLRETRTISADFPFKCSLFIYGTKTAIFSLQDNNMHSAIIESERFTGVIKQLFLFTWNNLPR